MWCSTQHRWETKYIINMFLSFYLSDCCFLIFCLSPTTKMRPISGYCLTQYITNWQQLYSKKPPSSISGVRWSFQLLVYLPRGHHSRRFGVFSLTPDALPDITLDHNVRVTLLKVILIKKRSFTGESVQNPPHFYAKETHR